MIWSPRREKEAGWSTARVLELKVDEEEKE
jgi:hypothetical protein